jgi:hypothetical protein
MPNFDRFDICEAYYAIESDYNKGGWLQERPSNQRRREATHVQLHRMQFKPAPSFNGFESLTENGKEIYLALEERYGFALWPESYSTQQKAIQ